MAEIVNLRQFRKTANRKAARAAADANAARFGRSKAQKRLEAASAEKTARHLDGHLREADHQTPPAPASGPGTEDPSS